MAKDLRDAFLDLELSSSGKLELVVDDEEEVEDDVVGEKDNEAAAATEEEDTAEMAEEIKVT